MHIATRKVSSSILILRILLYTIFYKLQPGIYPLQSSSALVSSLAGLSMFHSKVNYHWGILKMCSRACNTLFCLTELNAFYTYNMTSITIFLTSLYDLHTQTHLRACTFLIYIILLLKLMNKNWLRIVNTRTFHTCDFSSFTEFCAETITPILIAVSKLHHQKMIWWGL